MPLEMPENNSVGHQAIAPYLQPQQPSPAWSQPVAPPQPQPEEEGLFFKETQGVPVSPDNQFLYDGYRKQWQDNFARTFRQRHFATLKEYEDYVKNLPGAIEEIKPDIQKISMDYMPKHLKEQLTGQQYQQQTVSSYRRIADAAKKLGPDWGVETNAKGEPVLKHLKMSQKEKEEMQMKRMELDLKKKELEIKKYEAMYGDTGTDETTPRPAAKTQSATTMQDHQQAYQQAVQRLQQNPNDATAIRVLQVMKRQGIIQ